MNFSKGRCCCKIIQIQIIANKQNEVSFFYLRSNLHSQNVAVNLCKIGNVRYSFWFLINKKFENKEMRKS